MIATMRPEKTMESVFDYLTERIENMVATNPWPNGRRPRDYFWEGYRQACEDILKLIESVGP
jgi:hypothetical protein